MNNTQRMMRNFIRKYGKNSFRELIDMLSENSSGQEIGDRFGVTRERARQWRGAFGNTIVYYQVHEDVASQLEKV